MNSVIFSVINTAGKAIEKLLIKACMTLDMVMCQFNYVNLH